MIATNLVGFEELPQTLPHYCLESFRRNKKPDALAYKIGDIWQRISGGEAIERIRRIALGLRSLGIEAGDRVAVISENRPEWSLTDLALLSVRAVNVPIYTTQAVDQQGGRRGRNHRLRGSLLPGGVGRDPFRRLERGSS